MRKRSRRETRTHQGPATRASAPLSVGSRGWGSVASGARKGPGDSSALWGPHEREVGARVCRNSPLYSVISSVGCLCVVASKWGAPVTRWWAFGVCHYRSLYQPLEKEAYVLQHVTENFHHHHRKPLGPAELKRIIRAYILLGPCIGRMCVCLPRTLRVNVLACGRQC